MTWDVYDRLPKIKMPTLVIAGKKDILIPPQNGKIIADRIPGSKLVYFEKSAHAIFEETDKMITTLLQFLA
jgi:pimeloyl-ACP methyl ester carboxylesterase